MLMMGHGLPLLVYQTACWPGAKASLLTNLQLSFMTAPDLVMWVCTRLLHNTRCHLLFLATVLMPAPLLL